MNTTIGSIDTAGVFAAINREIAIHKSRAQARITRHREEGCVRDSCACQDYDEPCDMTPCASDDCFTTVASADGVWTCESCQLDYCDSCVSRRWRKTINSEIQTICETCHDIYKDHGAVNYFVKQLWSEYRLTVFTRLSLLKAYQFARIETGRFSSLTKELCEKIRDLRTAEEALEDDATEEFRDAEEASSYLLLAAMDATEHAAGLRKEEYDGDDWEEYVHVEAEVAAYEAQIHAIIAKDARAKSDRLQAEAARARARRMRANSGAECVYCHTHYVREHFNTDGKCMDCFVAPPDIDSDSEAAVRDSGVAVHA